MFIFIFGIVIFFIFSIFSIFIKSKQIEYYEPLTYLEKIKKIKKDKWIIYNASKDKEYILTKNKEKYITYSDDVQNGNEKKIYNIYDKNKKNIGTTGIQYDKDVISINGRFNTTVVTIKFTNSEERIIINIGNNQTIITGYGSFSNDNPYPWSKVIPIIYKEGETVIAIMDSANSKTVKETSKNIPMEIIVSHANEKYVPLFFETFVLLQEYISHIQ